VIVRWVMDPRRSPQGRVDDVAVGDGVLQALAYADVFDWPLSMDEVHRYLPVSATRPEVVAAIWSAHLAGRVEVRGDLVCLRNRDGLIARRHELEANAAALWPHAVRFGRIMSRLPGVRFVAVTGSLAVGAPAAGADVDLFLVTVDGRLWLTRALAIAVVRWARLRRVVLCPNFIVTTSALRLDDRDAFTAHELMQLVPLHGPDLYDELLASNGWYRDHLPNHHGHHGAAELAGGRLRRLGERLLCHRAVLPLERWEMDRKIARLDADHDDGSTEVRFDATTCKGHFEGHRRRVLAAYESRLRHVREMT